MAFDDFWERHRTKLEQCLQLRHFEQHFREVSLVDGTCHFGPAGLQHVCTQGNAHLTHSRVHRCAPSSTRHRSGCRVSLRSA